MEAAPLTDMGSSYDTGLVKFVEEGAAAEPGNPATDEQPSIIDAMQKNTEEGNVNISMEFFPPKTEAGARNLLARVDRMSKVLFPLWVDVTCFGATAADREKTLRVSSDILNFTKQTVMMHITCLNLSRKAAKELLERARGAGIRNLLVLKGDPGSRKFKPSPGGFRIAEELVVFIREKHADWFTIGVAGNCEYAKATFEDTTDDHTVDSSELSQEPDSDQSDEELPPVKAAPPDVRSGSSYLASLRSKVQAGADFIVTQLLYQSESYFSFVAQCREVGINCPIIPGVMPIQNYQLFERIAATYDVTVPAKVLEELQLIKEDDDKVKKYGIASGIEIAKNLLAGGAPGVHFFTMNLEQAVCSIARNLGKVDLSWQKGQACSLNAQCEEEVRPIFWANRPHSYIERSAAWDEYPNGRWGDRRSPAYGECLISTVYHGTKEERRKAWSVCPGRPEDVYETFARYIEGVVMRIPWCVTPLAKETSALNTTLQRFNRAGFLTINSQPAQNCYPSSDPNGWGPEGGYVYQKAYLEFFCSPERFEELNDSFQSFPNLTFHAVNSQGDAHSNCANVNAVTWGVFPGREILQPTVVDPDSFVTWREEAFALWKVWSTIYEKRSTSRLLIDKLRTTYWLVNVVDNDFVKGSSSHNGLGCIYDIIDGLIVDGPCMICLLYTSPSPRDRTRSRMPSSA
eukprot:TRINITY_DN15868_c0_g1_i1.p1 TRINITY_DN15868_c0_g1~~TRINITY_DN15868_c0_g1_i1.p1  ORF type:complete len:687 (+),score=108.24 TRINITY_DN15868_c0_g1_i1:79-2139(+)